MDQLPTMQKRRLSTRGAQPPSRSHPAECLSLKSSGYSSRPGGSVLVFLTRAHGRGKLQVRSETLHVPHAVHVVVLLRRWAPGSVSKGAHADWV